MGKLYFTHVVYSGKGALLTSAEDISRQWKEYFEDLLNPMDKSSKEEAEYGSSERDFPITRTEATQVVANSSVPGPWGWMSTLKLWMLLGCLG